MLVGLGLPVRIARSFVDRARVLYAVLGDRVAVDEVARVDLAKLAAIVPEHVARRRNAVIARRVVAIDAALSDEVSRS